MIIIFYFKKSNDETLTQIILHVKFLKKITSKIN